MNQNKIGALRWKWRWKCNWIWTLGSLEPLPIPFAFLKRKWKWNWTSNELEARGTYTVSVQQMKKQVPCFFLCIFCPISFQKKYVFKSTFSEPVFVMSTLSCIENPHRRSSPPHRLPFHSGSCSGFRVGFAGFGLIWAN